MRKLSKKWCRRLSAALAVCLLPLLLAAAPAAGALQPETPRPILQHWTSEAELSPYLAQRSRGDGPAISDQQRQHLQQQYRKWRALPPEEQQKLRRRQQELEQMPPESRRLYQKRFQQWQDIPDSERQQLRRQMDNWEQLSPQEREAVRRRFND
jgi:hypothetical protein